MQCSKKVSGFTLVELLVVMAIIATLLTLAAPRYIGNVEKAKEATLKENLSTIRDVLDKYYADRGQYPATLNDLVTHKYLRRVPVDPITESSKTWIRVLNENEKVSGIVNVFSGAKGKARDGTFYKKW